MKSELLLNFCYLTRLTYTQMCPGENLHKIPKQQVMMIAKRVVSCKMKMLPNPAVTGLPLGSVRDVHPTPSSALVCECSSLYGVYEEFCPKYK